MACTPNGGYPDIDGLFREQGSEPDRKKREAILHKIQQLMHDKAIFAPLFEPAFLNATGRGWRESGLGLSPITAIRRPTRT